MTTDAKKLWLETRLPGLAAWRAGLNTPALAREKPYLATLPVLITGALIFMALSGFVLSLFYNPADAFNSIQFIDRNVHYGWLIHAFHETGTTMIFGAVYLALFSAISNRAYKAPGELVWFLSLAQFVLLLFIGWLGYVLADGAVSYWSLANNVSAATAMNGLPGGIGAWFFGGPAGPGTLARLAVFHAVLALAIFGIVALYFIAERAVEPAVPIRKPVSFHPYYTAQYFAAFCIFALIFGILVFFAPHLGENPLNRAAADPLVMPVVATPPWYLLAVTAAGGITLVVAKLAVLFALPWLDRSPPGKPPGFLLRFLVVVLAIDVIALSIAAAQPPSLITSILVILFTAWYFLHFLVLTPLVTAMEAA
jgi:ubiquinol-cytochrome c reductase cytochrome b subunit